MTITMGDYWVGNGIWKGTRGNKVGEQNKYTGY